MGLLHALARVVAPTIFNLIYSLTVATMPQTVFISLSAVFGAAFALSFFIRPHGMFCTQSPLSCVKIGPSFLTVDFSIFGGCHEFKNRE